MTTSTFLPSVAFQGKSLNRFGRVQVIQNGNWDQYRKCYNADARGQTVATSSGDLLRGANFWCFHSLPGHMAYAETPEAWEIVRSNHLNTVRLALNGGERGRGEDLAGWLKKVDGLVDLAQENGLYVILDHHEAGQHTQAWLREFWYAVAPRYANREHVIYEIANEPVRWLSTDYTEQDLRDIEEIYSLIRRHAPETHVILMSFAVPDIGMREACDRLQGIDWSNASVGFHGYWTNSSESAIRLKAAYPVINTEFMSYVTKHAPANWKMDGALWQTQVMERLKISWQMWDIAYRKDYVGERLKPMLADAKRRNYAWW